MVTMSYVRNVSEALKRSFRRYGVAAAMKPHHTLRQLLVHLKDKRTPQHMAGVVYSIPCTDFLNMYVGETDRQYKVREKEHMNDVSQLEGVKYTRARTKESQIEVYQSVLTDQEGSCNHTVDWEKVRFLAIQPDRCGI